MSRVKIILVVMLSCCVLASFHAQEQHSKNAQDNVEISETWQQFLTAIASKDKKQFKALSTGTIKCYDCLENTNAEIMAMDSLRTNDSNWYERIYDDMIYIPRSTFIAEDYDLLFTPNFVKILQENRTQIVAYDVDNVTRYEVLVTTIEASEDFEGMQHAFMFVKVGKAFKFSELSTIP